MMALAGCEKEQIDNPKPPVNPGDTTIVVPPTDTIPTIPTDTIPVIPPKPVVEGRASQVPQSTLYQQYSRALTYFWNENDWEHRTLNQDTVFRLILDRDLALQSSYIVCALIEIMDSIRGRGGQIVAEPAYGILAREIHGPVYISNLSYNE
ncbi:MAG: hypothetical protein LBU51_02925, partial [Bacteroidales bacterium]|nr:hypothetical protein [Bacteroidales bacterium]